jgi:hypothetical protein
VTPIATNNLVSGRVVDYVEQVTSYTLTIVIIDPESIIHIKYYYSILIMIFITMFTISNFNFKENYCMATLTLAMI